MEPIPQPNQLLSNVNIVNRLIKIPSEAYKNLHILLHLYLKNI